MTGSESLGSDFFLGAGGVALVHALLPDHWLPFVLVARSQRWKVRKLLTVTGLTGIAHSLSTVLLGVLVSILGRGFESRVAGMNEPMAGMIFCTLGLAMMVWGRFGRHSHIHGHGEGTQEKAVIGSLVLALTVSPCVAMVPFYFVMGSRGTLSFLFLSVIVICFTVCGMMIMTALNFFGVERIKSDFIDRHERTIVGGIILLIGVVVLLEASL